MKKQHQQGQTLSFDDIPQSQAQQQKQHAKQQIQAYHEACIATSDSWCNNNNISLNDIGIDDQPINNNSNVNKHSSFRIQNIKWQNSINIQRKSQGQKLEQYEDLQIPKSAKGILKKEDQSSMADAEQSSMDVGCYSPVRNYNQEQLLSLSQKGNIQKGKNGAKEKAERQKAQSMTYRKKNEKTRQNNEKPVVTIFKSNDEHLLQKHMEQMNVAMQGAFLTHLKAIRADGVFYDKQVSFEQEINRIQNSNQFKRAELSVKQDQIRMRVKEQKKGQRAVRKFCQKRSISPAMQKSININTEINSNIPTNANTQLQTQQPICKGEASDIDTGELAEIFRQTQAQTHESNVLVSMINDLKTEICRLKKENNAHEKLFCQISFQREQIASIDKIGSMKLNVQKILLNSQKKIKQQKTEKHQGLIYDGQESKQITKKDIKHILQELVILQNATQQQTAILQQQERELQTLNSQGTMKKQTQIPAKQLICMIYFFNSLIKLIEIDEKGSKTSSTTNNNNNDNSLQLQLQEIAKQHDAVEHMEITEKHFTISKLNQFINQVNESFLSLDEVVQQGLRIFNIMSVQHITLQNRFLDLNHQKQIKQLTINEFDDQLQKCLEVMQANKRIAKTQKLFDKDLAEMEALSPALSEQKNNNEQAKSNKYYVDIRSMLDVKSKKEVLNEVLQQCDHLPLQKMTLAQLEGKLQQLQAQQIQYEEKRGGEHFLITSFLFAQLSLNRCAHTISSLQRLIERHLARFSQSELKIPPQNQTLFMQSQTNLKSHKQLRAILQMLQTPLDSFLSILKRVSAGMFPKADLAMAMNLMSQQTTEGNEEEEGKDEALVPSPTDSPKLRKPYQMGLRIKNIFKHFTLKQVQEESERPTKEKEVKISENKIANSSQMLPFSSPMPQQQNKAAQNTKQFLQQSLKLNPKIGNQQNQSDNSQFQSPPAKFKSRISTITNTAPFSPNIINNSSNAYQTKTVQLTDNQKTFLNMLKKYSETIYPYLPLQFHNLRGLFLQHLPSFEEQADSFAAGFLSDQVLFFFTTHSAVVSYLQKYQQKLNNQNENKQTNAASILHARLTIACEASRNMLELKEMALNNFSSLFNDIFSHFAELLKALRVCAAKVFQLVTFEKPVFSWQDLQRQNKDQMQSDEYLKQNMRYQEQLRGKATKIQQYKAHGHALKRQMYVQDQYKKSMAERTMLIQQQQKEIEQNNQLKRINKLGSKSVLLSPSEYSPYRKGKSKANGCSFEVLEGQEENFIIQQKQVMLEDIKQQLYEQDHPQINKIGSTCQQNLACRVVKEQQLIVRQKGKITNLISKERQFENKQKQIQTQAKQLFNKTSENITSFHLLATEESDNLAFPYFSPSKQASINKGPHHKMRKLQQIDYPHSERVITGRAKSAISGKTTSNRSKTATLNPWDASFRKRAAISPFEKGPLPMQQHNHIDEEEDKSSYMAQNQFNKQNIVDEIIKSLQQ